MVEAGCIDGAQARWKRWLKPWTERQADRLVQTGRDAGRTRDRRKVADRGAPLGTVAFRNGRLASEPENGTGLRA